MPDTLTEPRKVGRPTKFTPARREHIASLLADGCTRKMAAKLAGVGNSTLMKWLQQSGEEFVEFREQVEQAEASFQRQQIHEILQSRDWKAKAWVLERMFPDEFGKRDKVSVQHSVNVSLERIKSMPTAELEARLGELQALPPPEVSDVVEQ